MSRRDCIWCGQPGRKSTEDVVPQWIAREYQQRFWQLTPNFAIQRPGLWHDEDNRKITPAKRIKIDLTVCASCNNGWMSHLENRTKPILPTLIFSSDLRPASQPLSLTQATADLVSAWSAKTLVNVVFERLNQAEKLLPIELRGFIRNRAEPPPGTLITALKIDGQVAKVGTTATDIPIRKTGGRKIGDITIASVRIGCFAVQMVHSAVRQPQPKLPLHQGGSSVVLWPKSARPSASGPISWPDTGLDEDDFKRLCSPSAADVETCIL